MSNLACSPGAHAQAEGDRDEGNYPTAFLTLCNIYCMVHLKPPSSVCGPGSPRACAHYGDPEVELLSFPSPRAYGSLHYHITQSAFAKQRYAARPCSRVPPPP